MTWREAFLAQARHEHAIYVQFSQRGAAMADQLHYLQMATEKLARGYLAHPSDPEPPETTHAGFIRLLQQIKADPPLRRRLGFTNSRVFSAFVDSLLDLAGKVQALAPAIAGTTRPNPEYPWVDSKSKAILVPFQFQSSELGEFKNARATKLLNLVRRLVIVIT